MMKKLILFGLLIIGLFDSEYLLAQEFGISEKGRKVILFENGSWVNYDESKKSQIRMELPRIHPNDQIVHHTGFSLCYNEEHEQANWVAYAYPKANTQKVASRTDKFLPDTLVVTGSADKRDYEKSGFDRGHLAPAADMAWSETAMAESFYYSNMSPQTPSFNRGIWKKLEDRVRTWAAEHEVLYVSTGPVLTSDLKKIGHNNVSVPSYFYKVILDEKNGKAIGFVLSNEGSSNPIENFAVTIDSVEKLTGLDFFPNLQDSIEDKIESKLCIPCWTWRY